MELLSIVNVWVPEGALYFSQPLHNVLYMYIFCFPVSGSRVFSCPRVIFPQATALCGTAFSPGETPWPSEPSTP